MTTSIIEIFVSPIRSDSTISTTCTQCWFYNEDYAADGDDNNSNDDYNLGMKAVIIRVDKESLKYES